MQRIEEFSDDELLEELFKRYHSCIFAGRKNMTTVGPLKVDRRRVVKGDYEICMGLANAVIKKVADTVYGNQPENNRG